MISKVGKNLVASFSYKEDKETLLQELNVIAAREGKKRSELIMDLIEVYVKAHSSGNPNFTIDNWQQDSEFIAVPALLETKDKWNKFLSEYSDPKERIKILDNVNAISNMIKTINYHESKKNIR